MLIPAVLYTVVFGYCTLPYMLIAFQKFSYKTGLFGSEWVGLKNFRFFFGSQDALRVISNTLKLNLLFIVCTIAISVTLAIMINEIRNKYFKKVAQSTYLLPYFLSWVIVNYILYAFCGPQWPPVRLPVATRRCQWTGLISYFSFDHYDVMFRHPFEKRVGGNLILHQHRRPCLWLALRADNAAP